MIAMSDGGKGSAPRPIPDRKKFEENWDRIFKPKKEKDASSSRHRDKPKA